MSIQLILFDLDGTLVDTSRDITNALNYALRPYGLDGISVEATIKVVGEGLTRLIEKVLGEERYHLKDAVSKRFLEYYSAHLIDNSMIYPDVKETLDMLSGYRKAVISNKRENLSVNLLKQLDIDRHFELIVGSDTTPERKPSAGPLLYVFSKLHISPLEALMVGDSQYDIEAGHNAGVKTVAVTYGYQERRLLTAADYIIDSFRDLPGILDIASSKFI
jgi:phosphoglycolate phosphatase